MCVGLQLNLEVTGIGHVDGDLLWLVADIVHYEGDSALVGQVLQCEGTVQASCCHVILVAFYLDHGADECLARLLVFDHAINGTG